MTYKHIMNNRAYFPICASYTDHTHTHYYRRDTGKGNCALTREMYELNTEGWWEKKSWGREDDRIFDFYHQRGKIVRDYTETFFHQWHPTLKYK